MSNNPMWNLPRKQAVSISLVFLLIALSDLLARFMCTKYLCSLNFGAVGINTFQNSSSAFSLSQATSLSLYLPIALVIAILGASAYNFLRRKSQFDFRWVMLAGFALLNILDRVVHGFVTDYIRIFSGYFNLADFAILYLLVWIFLKK